MRETSGFVRVDGREVRYRHWGEGPLILLIHGSPQSSRAVRSAAEALAARGFSALAPDTPGNGLSTPLPLSEPTTADYARALIAFLDAAGIARAPCYGFHTGAATAATAKALFPDRIGAVVLDGLPAWSDEERAELEASYLPPIVPSWDGGHLTWLWARLEEQTLFFPWFRRAPASRMDYDVSPAEALHANALDLLQAGDAHRAPYRAALRFDAREWVSALGADVLWVSAARDPLRPHKDRAALASLSTYIGAEADAVLARAGDFFAEALADQQGSAPFAPSPARLVSEAWTHGFAGAGMRIGVRGAEGPARLYLHRAGGRLEDLEDGLAGADPGVQACVELPGHGASSPWEAGVSLGDLADQVISAVRATGLEVRSVAGEGLGGAIAAELRRQGRVDAAGRFGREAVRPEPTMDLDAFAARMAPALSPEWDGAHLVRAFRIARFSRLFRPWFARDRRHRLEAFDLDPSSVHDQAFGLILAADALRPAIRLEAQHANDRP